MRGASEIIVHVPAHRVVVQAVAQAPEQSLHLGRGQQVEQHQHVGLFGDLIPVGAVVLGLQDAVEAVDVAVFLAVAVPVEYAQSFESLELADDLAAAVVAVGGNVHLARDVGPAVALGRGDGEGGSESSGVFRRDQVQDVQRPQQRPDGHDVGVGVVAQPGCVRLGIGFVVFVGTHHSVNFVASPLRIQVGRAGPEPRDVQEQCGAVRGQEFHVQAGLVVLPDVVGDGDVHVPLQGAVVRDPPPGRRVEVDDLTLFAPVAAALPRKHGARVAGPLRRGPCLRQPPIPVRQQRPGQLGLPEREEGKDEQFVPEDVAAVRLAVQAACRNADVQGARVLGCRLQEVEGVKTQQPLGARLPADGDVVAVPHAAPRRGMGFEQTVEPPGTFESLGEGYSEGVRLGVHR